jgi:hypothetical protein
MQHNTQIEAANQTITCDLPDNSSLYAEICTDPEYPGIRIVHKRADGTEEMICFAEHNSAKPEGKQLYIGAYVCDMDEPAYYESYFAPERPIPIP